jgi:hypothetical protein
VASVREPAFALYTNCAWAAMVKTDKQKSIICFISSFLRVNKQLLLYILTKSVPKGYLGKCWDKDMWVFTADTVEAGREERMWSVGGVSLKH